MFAALWDVAVGALVGEGGLHSGVHQVSWKGWWVRVLRARCSGKASISAAQQNQACKPRELLAPCACGLWEGKAGRANKTGLIFTSFYVWVHDTSPSEPSFHQKRWDRTASGDIGWGFVASENHSPLGPPYVSPCKSWSLNLGSLKERTPFSPSR